MRGERKCGYTERGKCADDQSVQRATRMVRTAAPPPTISTAPPEVGEDDADAKGARVVAPTLPPDVPVEAASAA
jgi:hypothetical protein